MERHKWSTGVSCGKESSQPSPTVDSGCFKVGSGTQIEMVLLGGQTEMVLLGGQTETVLLGDQ